MIDNKIESESAGARLKKLIRSRGMTQKEFAEEIDWSEQMISQYTSGRAQMSVNFMKAAAQALNTSVDYLSMRSDDPDLPDHLTALTKNAPWGSETDKLSMLIYRINTIRQLLETQGVRRLEYVRVGSEEYCSHMTVTGCCWIDSRGNEISTPALLDMIRSDHDNAEQWVEVSFADRTIRMGEDDYNLWLLSMWNTINLNLQARFGLPRPIINEPPATDMSRALRGLKPIDFFD